MKEERIMNLKWSYPDFPPRPIKRDVIFSLMYYNGALYFVNGSNEVLATVSSESFGFILSSSLENNPKFYYENVKPNESVKVEEYDDYYDLDFVLGFEIFIQSEKLGRIKIIPPMKKGGVKAQELIFSDMSTPRYVTFESM
jgi:hypothetical protein